MALIGSGDAASRGTEIKVLLPMTAGAPCPLLPQQRDWDILLTAETHNFPCAVAPFPGVLLQCPRIKSALRRQLASQVSVAQLDDIFSVCGTTQSISWSGLGEATRHLQLSPLQSSSTVDICWYL